MLSDTDFKAFQDAWGGAKGAKGDREACVRVFAYSGDKRQQYDQTIVYLLTAAGVPNLKTEAQKLSNAATDSASAAKESARVAVLSLRVAILAASVAIGAVVVQLMAR